MHWNWETFYAKASEWIVTSAPRFLGAVIFCIIGIWIIRRVGKWLRQSFERKNINPSIPIPAEFYCDRITGGGVYTGFPDRSIQLTFLTAVVAGLSVAFGLALSGTLQNFMSGILILVLHPFKAGDRIITQGQEGIVSSIQLFYTVYLLLITKQL